MPATVALAVALGVTLTLRLERTVKHASVLQRAFVHYDETGVFLFCSIVVVVVVVNVIVVVVAVVVVVVVVSSAVASVGYDELAARGSENGF